MELAEHFFIQESSKGKVECIQEAFRLCHQITVGYGLGEPYYLVPDNDVLNALQKPNEYRVRYIALILLFRVIKKLNRDFRIAINTAIFFEFNGDKSFQSQEGFESGWFALRKSLAQTELPIFSYGLDTFERAKAQLKSIKHDIRKIEAALHKIKRKKWRVNLRSELGVTFPHAIARETCPTINTKYFSSHHTRIFLESVIESRIVNHKDNDSYARKRLRHDGTIKRSRLLENKKGQLKGIGDLSLMSLCDIGTQFHRQRDCTSIAITFDVRLERLLIEHSGIVVRSQPLASGIESDDTTRKKMEDFYERSQKARRVDKKAQEFFAEFVNELENISWLKDVLTAELNESS